MADRVRVSVSVSPQVEMTDTDADSVYSVHHDIGRTVGSMFNIDVSKWAIDLAKNITSTSGELLIGASSTKEYTFLFVKNTGLDSHGDEQARSLSISLGGSSEYEVELAAGESITIPSPAIAEEKIFAKCSSASGIVCEYVGGYTT